MDYIFQTAEKIYRSFGFSKIENPIMEYTELFNRSIGTYTDIVQKEMFTFNDRKNRSITLRPEGTAGVVRSYIDNNFAFNPGITKVFYQGPMFRAERPQKGRLREFHQFGCEAIGTINPLLDAEIIEIHINILKELQLQKFSLEINSVGCKTCREDHTIKLQKFLSDKKDTLCENCKIRAENNPLRIFDCKNPSCQEVYKNAPFLTGHLCDECNEHFNKLQYYLKNKNIPYSINKKLVRGFDYYSKTVFEIQSALLGAQNALLGGGRYDYLIELLGGKPTPAVGTAVGVERLMIALNETGISSQKNTEIKIYLAQAGNPDEKIKFKLIDFLRKQNYIPVYPYNSKSLKAQLKDADRLKCTFCLIIGEEELKNNQIVIRYLADGIQKNINLDDFFKNSKKILSND